MSAPGQVVASGATRRFATPHGHIDALVDVDLDLEAGSTLGVFGPSGCGKSTLLALLGALDVPTSGRVSLGGVELADLDRRQRARVRRTQYGFVFQTDGLMPFLTAEENVALQMILGGGESSTPLELLDRLGLSREAHRLPDQLSGGQRQRIAVATAVAHTPSVIIADEPTGSLDSGNAAAVVDLLLEARTIIDGTLIVASHDPAVCNRMSRTVVLRGGRVVEEVESIPPFGEDW